MVRSKRLKPVAKVTASREEQAARIFGEAQQRLAALSEQLNNVSDYRTEYSRGFNQRGAGGVNGNLIQDYLAFLQNLDGTILQVEQQIELAQKECEEKKQLWFLARNKSKLVDSLIERYLSDEESSAEKRTQREFDDRAGAKWGSSQKGD